MPASRKRSSAFEDFPAQDGASEAAAKITPSTPEPAGPPSVERIERLKPSEMMPDRFQPRHLLPAPLRAGFFSRQTDCYQTASNWLVLARSDAAYRGEVDRLTAMGSSFEEHGQIKPITGTWRHDPDGRYVFLIETGERRFWAACLNAVAEQANEEPRLRVEVVSQPSRQRQVLENRHAEAPSAVGQACEIAALILAEQSIQPDPELKDEFEYFRLARSQRMPAGLWERVMPIMQLTRPRMVQLLSILQMPSSLLEMVDTHRVPERVLREILELPREQWERMVRLAIKEEMTSDDVAELKRPLENAPKAHASGRASPAMLPPDRIAVSGLRRFANALTELDEMTQAEALDAVADTLIVTHQAEGMMILLGELAHLIELRQSGLSGQIRRV